MAKPPDWEWKLNMHWWAVQGLTSADHLLDEETYDLYLAPEVPVQQDSAAWEAQYGDRE